MNSTAKIRAADASLTEWSASGDAGRAWRGEFHQLRLRLYAFLLASDALCVATAFLIANQLRFGDMLVSYGVNTFAVLFPVYVAVGLNGGAWAIDALQNPRRSVAAAIRAFCFAVAVAAILFFSLKIGEDFSRLVFGIGSLLSLLLIGASRFSLGQRLGRRFDWTFQKRVLLLDGVVAVPVHNEIVVPADKEGLRPVTDDPAMLDRLGRLLDCCERVTLACPLEKREAWISGARRRQRRRRGPGTRAGQHRGSGAAKPWRQRHPARCARSPSIARPLLETAAGSLGRRLRATPPCTGFHPRRPGHQSGVRPARYSFASRASAVATVSSRC